MFSPPSKVLYLQFYLPFLCFRLFCASSILFRFSAILLGLRRLVLAIYTPQRIRKSPSTVRGIEHAFYPFVVVGQ